MFIIGFYGTVIYMQILESLQAKMGELGFLVLN